MKYLLSIIAIGLLCSCVCSTPDVPAFDEFDAAGIEQQIVANDIVFWEWVSAGIVVTGVISFLIGGYLGISKLTSISTIGIGIGISQINQIMNTYWFNLAIGIFIGLLLLDILYVVYIKTKEFLLDKNKL
ncbi:MAG: hypothetical protein EB127_05920 [Alphaproteobacteria bacterium]|nr:hypothetical protein [Alphaproteobacteria bacterium]